MHWTPAALCSVISLVLVVSCHSVAEPAQDQAGSTWTQQVDTAGDDLPPKARARLGTLRFGHVGFGVSALAFSQDGKMLASLGRDGIICTWDVRNGKRLGRFGFPNQDIQKPLAFSADGKVLVVKNRQLWDVATGKQLPVHVPPGFNAHGLAVAPDGKSIALACGPIYLRDFRKNEELRTFGDKDSGLYAVLFSPDGRTLIGGARAAGQGTIYFWDVATGAELRKIKGRDIQIQPNNTPMSPDGRILATGGLPIRLWDVATAQYLRQLDGGGFEFTFSADGKMIATWGHGDVTLYETAAGKVRAKQKPFAKYQMEFAFAFAPDGRTVAVAGDQGSIHLVELFTEKELRPRAGHGGAIVRLAMSADGKLLASAGSEGTVRLWDTVTGKESRQLPWYGGFQGVMALSPDGTILAAPSPIPLPPDKGDGGISLWDAGTAKRIGVIHEGVTNSGGHFRALAFSPDGRKLAATTWETRVWDVAAKKELYSLERETNPSPHLAFSPDGKILVTPGVTLWNADTGQKLHTLKTRAGERPFAWAADGMTLAVSDGYYGKDIHLFDTATGQRRQRFKTSQTSAIAFGPEDRILAAANEKQIVLWDVATMEEVTRFQGHEGAVTSLLFSPDRKTLYSGSMDRTVLVWDLADVRLAPPPRTPTLIVALPSEKALDRLRDAPTNVLLEALQHPEPAVRAAAVQRLGPLAKDKTVFTALFGALADKDDEVCSQAVWAVAGAGAAAKEAVPKLVEILKHPLHRNRTAAASALGFIGPEAKTALPALLAGLEAGQGNDFLRPIPLIDPRGDAVPLPLLLVVREYLDDQLADWALQALMRRSPADTKEAEKTRKNLGVLGKAMLAYAQEHQALPPSAIFDKAGQPLLSWRVTLLPYLGHEELFKKFHLEESWESPHNQKLLPLMPPAFAAARAPKEATFYQVITGKGTLFDGKESFPLPEPPPIGQSHLAMIVEAGRAVPWTKPEDVVFAKDRPLPDLGGLFPDRLYACFTDGMVHLLSPGKLKGSELKELMKSEEFPAINFLRCRYQAWEAPPPSLPPEPPQENTLQFDRVGDLLPPGAIQRLGTTRLRQPPSPLDHPDFRETQGKIAFSSDSKTLASLGGGALRLWDVASGQELLSQNDCYGREVVFSPDGTTLLLPGNKQGALIRRWDIATRKNLRRYDGRSSLDRFTLSRDGNWLAASNDHREAFIWDAATGKELRRFQTDYVSRLSFSPDGKFLLLGERLWDMATGKPLSWSLEGNETVTSASFSPDGAILATSHADPSPFGARFKPSVRLWDAVTGKPLRQFKGNQNYTMIVFSPDGKTLAVASDEAAVRLWDADTGKEVGRLPGFHFAVDNIVFSPDGKLLAGTDGDNRILIWGLATRKLLHPFQYDEGFVTAVAYAPDGKTIAVAGDDIIRVREVTTGKLLAELLGHKGRVLSLAFSADGKQVLSGSTVKDATTRLWDVTEGKEVRQWNDKGGVVALSPDGKYMASGRQPLRLREFPSEKEVARLDYHEIRAMAFSPDSKNLAVVPYGREGGIVHQVPTGEKVTHFGNLTDRPFLEWPTLAYAPDGRFLVYVHPRLGLTFLTTDTTTGKRSRFSWQDTAGARAVACAPDGKTLAIGWHRWHHVSLWDIASAKERFRFPGNDQVLAVAFSPDGTTLTARYGNGTAIVWRNKVK